MINSKILSNFQISTTIFQKEVEVVISPSPYLEQTGLSSCYLVSCVCLTARYLLIDVIQHEKVQTHTIAALNHCQEWQRNQVILL